MRIRILIPQRAQEETDRQEFDGFHLYLVEQKRCWPAVAASAVLHWAAASVFIVVQQLTSIGYEPPLRQGMKAPLLIRIPEPLYLPYSAKNRPPAVRGTARLSGERAGELGPKGVSAGSGYKVYARDRIELPVRPAAGHVKQTLLQPDTVIRPRPLDIRALPHMAYWSVTTSVPPAFVPAAGEAGTTSSQSVPRLDRTNKESRIGGIQMAKSTPTVDPALAVQPASTAPVKTDRESMNGRQGRIPDGKDTEPLSLLALNPAPAALTDHIVIPALSQLGQLPGQRGEDDAGGIKAETNAQAIGSAPGGGGGGKGEDGPGGTGRISHGPAGAAANGLGASGSRGNGGSELKGAMPGADIDSGAQIAGDVPVRVIHPENGVFDIVLVQPSPDEALPKLLSGRPIYTVYLRVGAEREWVLHYCVPGGREYRVGAGGNVVQLGNPAPVKAPYPKSTVIPSSMGRTTRLMLHGRLAAEGVLRGLEPVITEQKQLADALIPYLEQWEFRPATRGGRPMELEVVLMIPGAEHVKREDGRGDLPAGDTHDRERRVSRSNGGSALLR